MHEFQMIKTYFQDLYRSSRKDIILGSGDDCALLEPSKNQALAVSIDTLTSGVHFPKDFSPYDIGYKSLAVNLSDLAAMGATPAWFTCTLSLPQKHAEHAWLKDFSKGLKDIAKKYQISLVGGDLTYSKILSITIQVHGFVPKKFALKRSGAKVNDHIYVSGKLGYAILNDYYYKPEPRIELGIALRGKAHSAIDISDGLIADLSHILSASKVGASLYLDKIPLVHPKGLYAGDDYELCFTTSPDFKIKNLKHVKNINDIACIGKIDETPGLRIFYSENNPKIYPIRHKKGYQHF